jgi:VWFA-related protein
MRHPHRASTLAGIAALAAASAASQQTPSFPTARELVRVDVAVTDDQGNAVQGLTAADFVVTSDGKAVEIATFEAVVVRAPEREEAEGLGPVSDALPALPEETRAFLFFFDDVHLSPSGAEAARRALDPVLAQQVRPGDWVTVMSASGLKWTARTAAELRLLPQVLPVLSASRQLHTTSGHMVSVNAMTDYQAMMVARFGRYHSGVRPPDANDGRGLPTEKIAAREMPGGRQAETGAEQYSENQEQQAEAVRRYAEAQHRVGRSLDALRQAIAAFAGFRGRKSAFVYSEGFIRSPDLGDYDAVAALARRTRTTLYTIDPRRLSSGAQSVEGGLGTDDRTSIADERDETGGSDYVAIATGGRASRATDPTSLFREVAQEVSAYYLVGFDPPAGPAGERKLRVETKRKGARVHTLDRYLAGESAPPPGEPTMEEAVVSVFDATGVALRVGTATGENPGTTTLAVLFPRRAADGERTLDFRVEARPLGSGAPVRDGGEITLPPADRPAMARRTLSLAPGVWQVRVVARDRKTGQIGSVLHTFEVAAAAGS